MHQYPETGFKEFRTQTAIIEYLKSIGIKASQMQKIAGTGLVVDL
jgi:metal-dependent amidase/aminoacylase/carboxypeptidase family protein